ncbi:MAG TPA: hypothetical protein VLS27_06970 [Gammaproteobacteria bacterium]|nr:hypothetical protein [Gammaproteobacteria bacterium]
MSNRVLKDYDGLVTISWNDELESIYLKWHTEYDAGDRVVEAVKYALSYVTENRVKHWWVDLSTSKNGLKGSDQHWVQTEFGDLIAESPLTKLAMTPPLPETGQDVSWLDDWESNTNARYQGKIQARLARNEDEVRRYFQDRETGL